MKKILYVASVTKIHINAFHIPYFKKMKDENIVIHVASKNDYKNPKECIIPYCDMHHDLPFTRFPLSFDNLRSLIQLRRIIRKNDYDIVHCHTPTGGLVGRLAVFGLKNKPKVVYTAHGFHFYKGAPLANWILYYPFEFILSKITDLLITINEEDFARGSKMLCKNVMKVNGVGVRSNVTNATSSKEEKLNLISVGELNKNKNHILVLKALTKMTDYDFKYIICGKGNQHSKLTKYIKHNNLEGKVELLGYRDDIIHLLSISDVFIFPSKREGLPLSITEAMSCGLPIICSNIRGNIDLVVNGKGGYYFELNDTNSLYEKLKTILADKKIREEFGNFNKKRVEKFREDLVVNQVIKSYKSLVLDKDFQ